MFSDPIKNLKQLGLRENMLVADLGAGTGFYSLAAAKMVPNGKVYAVEIIRDYVHTIKSKAEEEHLKNLDCFWGNIEEVGGTKLKDSIIDVAIVSNTFSQIEDKERLIVETKRILKSGGKVLLIDWSDSESSFGPSKNDLIPKNKVLAMFERNGFHLEREIDAGEHHYGIILVLEK